tara:strand:+ start:460 stop:1266 length:807 start_codon:yes stop_codon:yes gene_type:complete
MNIKSIVNNLISPHKIPSKIINKLSFLLKKNNYKYELFDNEQNIIFKYFNLDREIGLHKLLMLKKKEPILNRNMSSEHEVFFSSLATSGKKIHSILEIGTFDGINSFLLSKLFRDAQIETIDLLSDTDDFKKFYNRGHRLNDFTNSRNVILSKSDRIFFKEMNSINLYNSNKKFDLVWIDGAHGYPVVCIDIINSLRLLNDNGIIMCDDIYINNIVLDKMYNSTAAFETLNELAKEKIIEYKLIYKRLDSENNCDKKNRKFIGVFRKI